MGTGKSTVGRELARLMGRKFVDTDIEVERLVGMSVKEIFELKGEVFFRQQEKQLSLELAATDNRVVATGGGTLLDAESHEAFRRSGIVICLFTHADQLVTRLERTDKRPLLQGDLKATVEALVAARRVVYDAIPIRVDTTNLTPPEAARKIHDLLKIRQKILAELQSQYIVIS